jgi:hypothetical protein
MKETKRRRSLGAVRSCALDFCEAALVAQRLA